MSCLLKIKTDINVEVPKSPNVETEILGKRTIKLLDSQYILEFIILNIYSKTIFRKFNNFVCR